MGISYEIYQGKDPLPVGYFHGDVIPVHENYNLVFEGEKDIPGNDLDRLEHLFMLHNRDDRPNPRGMWSLSCGDVVVLNPGTEQESAWLCEAIGWKKVEFPRKEVTV